MSETSDKVWKICGWFGLANDIWSIAPVAITALFGGAMIAFASWFQRLPLAAQWLFGVFISLLLLFTLAHIRWLIFAQGRSDEERKRDRIGAIVGGLLLCAALAASWVIGANSVQYAQTSPPVMVEWGNLGGNTFATIDATKASNDFRNRFRLMLVVRVRDSTIDAEQDRIIDKSNVFKIPDGQVRIEMPVSLPSMERLFTNRMMEVYLLCLPIALEPVDWSTITEAKSKLGLVCDTKAFRGPEVERTAVPQALQ